ncbi:LysR family transcriptional regulator [Thalassococcus sp. CAU 1522]|uniref:LysR family transcriptional regulator n=1 Tax=Thalassococcus arenae TaxID=2851652 RepID=A0ABS6N8K9_9RHOB|nr:LysR family transcriptional regulator [Thalassococcus arenae]MBV2360017.1 LysR family transcriptional regulator [Thalassococcus arenae]
MHRTNLSLRGLEVFQLLAKTGSLRAVAADTGLSVSTVSHHLRNVEESLGVNLMDHSRRPMVLTPAGEIFVRYVEEGLRIIRRGETELISGNLAEARDLRLGIVDDFDTEVAPELAQFLAKAMPKCTFKHHTRPSHEIIGMLMDRKLDAGVATQPVADVTGLLEYPVLRDPFVLAVPARAGLSGSDCLNDRTGLPFIRYSHNQIIGAMIETHLRRLKVTLPNRFELESNPAILGMVADGSGWAITTPGCYVRAKRFHNRITLLPFPGKGFARTVSLFTTDIYPVQMAEMLAGTMRRLTQRHFVDLVVQGHPWLTAEFRVMGETDQATAP